MYKGSLSRKYIRRELTMTLKGTYHIIVDDQVYMKYKQCPVGWCHGVGKQVWSCTHKKRKTPIWQQGVNQIAWMMQAYNVPSRTSTSLTGTRIFRPRASLTVFKALLQVTVNAVISAMITARREHMETATNSVRLERTNWRRTYIFAVTLVWAKYLLIR